MRISDWSSDVCSSDLGLELSADARFSDSYQSSIDNAVADKVDPYVVVNAQAGYRLNDNLRGFAFVTNLFDSRSEEHTSELQSLMRISYAVFCLKKKKIQTHNKYHHTHNL